MIKLDKKYLNEIINSNQGLLEDLLKSKVLRENLVGILRSIEASIPEDSRENFYKNLKTLRISFNKEGSFSLNDVTFINIDT